MAELKSRVHEVADAWEWLELAYQRGWTDGLPVAPPTEEKVAEVIDYLGRDPQEVLGIIPPANGAATIEKVAINSVMAGCKPEYVPVVLAALEAMLQEEFNLHGVQGTTNPCAPLVIVSGPIVTQLDFNYRHGTFAGGSRANATIGRAIRLLLWNVGGGVYGVTDMATLGHPGKYAYCVAENPETNPWPPFHQSRVVGVNPDQSAVTVFACDAPHAIYTPGTAQRILNVLAHSLPTLGVNMFHCAGEMLLALSAKPAAELARAGYAREDLQRYFFEKARYHLGELRRLPEALAPHDQAGNYWGATVHRPDVEAMADDEMLPMVKRPQDIHILATGGDAQWWCAFCPGWGDYGGLAVTRPVRMP